MHGISQSFLTFFARRAAATAIFCLAVLAASPLAASAAEVAGPVPVAWRGDGHWGWHDGRWGWWWIGPAGVWTWYAFNPYYPYYPPYGYPYYPYYGYPYPPPEANLPLSNMPPPPQSWYYCESAKGYYPHVARCPEGWRAVPATPEGSSGSPPAAGQKQ